jgi:activator of HSP90 ATPase
MADFKKYYKVTAEHEIVYQALTNAATIRLWTGADAIMEAVENSEFSLWEDSICGRNIRFVANQEIVQEWYFGEREEQSIVTIKLHADKQNTSVEVRQTNIPEEDFEDIAYGWTHVYMAALIDFYK